MTRTPRWLVAAAVVWLLALVTWQPVAAARQAAAPTPPIWAGVYTAEQATNGEAAYMSRCAGCHRADLGGGQTGANFAPALGGAEFMQRWDSSSVNRLYRIIRDTMPRGTPGILGEQSTLDVVAFILKFNGFPAGMAALNGDAAALEKVTFLPKPGTAVVREVANFAPVEATGCLTRGPSGWTLTNATDPRSATANSPVPSADVPLGSQTYRLVSPAAFGLDARAGSKVRIKGIIRRDPDETLVNLTGVDTVAGSCGSGTR